MNAAPVRIPPHTALGLDVPWSPAMDALYPADVRGETDTVTLDYGALYGRPVVRIVEDGPWVRLDTLPADVRAAVQDAEAAAYKRRSAEDARRRAASEREEAGLAAYEEQERRSFYADCDRADRLGWI